MFKSLSNKMIILLFFLIVAPMVFLGYFQSREVKSLNNDLLKIVQDTNSILFNKSTKSLNQLGEKNIKQSAITTAHQVETYLKFNSKLTANDLKNDAYFRQIVVQLVGDTGYTAITNSDTLYNFIHKQANIEGTDLSLLSSRLPDFWQIISNTKGGKPGYGYYNWVEPDGSTRQKFMYIEPIGIKTADGVSLSVAATTYIDEFSRPAKDMSNDIEKGIGEISFRSNQAISNSLSSLISLIFLLILASFIIGYFFVKQISNPLKRLTKAVKESGSGEITSDINIVSNDELGLLANTFKQIFLELKQSRVELEHYNEILKKEVSKKTEELKFSNNRLEEKVAERTKELEGFKNNQEKIINDRTKELNTKLAEVEKLNKFMINRETKMIALKKELDVYKNQFKK